MSTKAEPKRRSIDPTATTTTGLRMTDSDRLIAIAGTYRLSKIEAIGALLDAFEAMSPEQQMQVIRRQSAEA